MWLAHIKLFTQSARAIYVCASHTLSAIILWLERTKKRVPVTHSLQNSHTLVQPYRWLGFLCVHACILHVCANACAFSNAIHTKLARSLSRIMRVGECRTKRNTPARITLPKLCARSADKLKLCAPPKTLTRNGRVCVCECAIRARGTQFGKIIIPSDREIENCTKTMNP